MGKGITILITKQGIMTIKKTDLAVTEEIKEFIISEYNDELKKVTAKINPDNKNWILATYENGKEYNINRMYFDSMVKEGMRERIRQLAVN